MLVMLIILLCTHISNGNNIQQRPQLPPATPAENAWDSLKLAADASAFHKGAGELDVLAAGGDPQAQLYIAALYSLGLGRNRSVAKAILHYHFALMQVPFPCTPRTAAA